MASFRTLLVAIATVAIAAPLPAQSAPERLADTTFWRLMRDLSEPGGHFRSENLVSNETSLQWIIPELVRRVPPGGVYVGVAPDQNFTYVTALRPAIAFIVDIRHQNAMQHLMYKALIELSATRAEFLARLFGRAPLAGVDTASSAEALFAALSRHAPDSARYRAAGAAVLDQLVRVHGFELTASERTALACVQGAFFTIGPELTYAHGSECGNPGADGAPTWAGGPRPGFRMPSYQAMMTETDSAGTNWSYLGSEARFRALKAMQERNLVVPLTGNFAGDRALRAVGQWATAHGLRVTAFYVSNVEQYLFRQGDEAARFYANAATLPVGASSVFIRSFAAGRFGGGPTTDFKAQSPNGRSLQFFSSIPETLRAFGEGRLTSWVDVIRMSEQ